MQFSKSVPDYILEFPTTARFLAVLDSLNEYKQEIIAEALRANNPVLCMDKKWLLRYLTDYGYVNVPEEFSVFVMQQMALNADLIFRLRGSAYGLQILCNIVTLGAVTIDLSNFTKDFDYLVPESSIDGYITGSKETTGNTDDPLWRYLIDNNVVDAPRSLTIKIYGGVWNAAIKEYLEYAVEKYIGFHPNCTITITHINRTIGRGHGVLHEALNQNFIGTYVDIYAPQSIDTFNEATDIIRQ